MNKYVVNRSDVVGHDDDTDVWFDDLQEAVNHALQCSEDEPESLWCVWDASGHTLNLIYEGEVWSKNA